MKKFPAELFITGTDTGVGKTIISSILIAGLNAAYWKPIQAGTGTGTDSKIVEYLTGLPENRFYQEAYQLRNPISPHAAAELEGVKINLENIKLPGASGFKHLIIEGAGGIMVPLNDMHLMIDLIRILNVSVLIVARNKLGTINHSLMTIEELKRHRLEIFGVVLVGRKNKINKEAIESFGEVKVIAEIDYMKNLEHQDFGLLYQKYFSKYE